MGRKTQEHAVLSVTEIAAELGISRQSVTKTLRKAERKVRAAIVSDSELMSEVRDLFGGEWEYEE